MILCLIHIFMPRGGRREGAGRRTGWRHPETQTIRVPKVFANRLLEIARKLDSHEAIDFDTESNLESVTDSVKVIVSRWRDQYSSASSKSLRRDRVSQLLDDLEGVLQGKIVSGSGTESNISTGQMDLLSHIEQDLAADKGVPENDSVSKSSPASLAELEPLSERALARRIGIDSTRLLRRRQKLPPPELTEWIRSEKPDEPYWQYRHEERRYYPTFDLISENVTESETTQSSQPQSDEGAASVAGVDL